VDNQPLDLLPDIEAYARLLDLRNRYGLETARQLGARTVVEQHFLDHGHPLAFGCCRDVAAISPNTR